MGRAVSQLLDAGPAGRRVARNRLRAGAGEGAFGAPHCLPGQPGTLWSDRRVLPPPRRVAVVRPQRGMRTARPLSRLEVRRCRAMRRSPFRTGGERLRQEDQGHVVSAGRPRRHPMDLYGAAGSAAAAAGMGVHAGAEPAAFRLKAAAGVQLAASHGGGIDSSHVSFLHRGNINSDPLFKGAKGNQYNLKETRGRCSKSSKAQAASNRRAPQCRGRQLLLAHHPICAAVLHHDRAARRAHLSRPLLDSYRRRELLGLESYDYHPTRDITNVERRAMQDGKVCIANWSREPIGRWPTRTTTT